MGHGGGDDGGNDERWLVSYADFITLLMVMFVVFYSMSQVDVEKYKKLSESMRVVFNGGGPSQVVDANINQGGGAEDGVSKPITIPGIPRQPPDASYVAGQLNSMLLSFNLGSGIYVETTIEGILISLSEKLLFLPGTQDLTHEAYQVLDTISVMLNPVDNQIKVVGHTDSTPPIDPRYKDNWELSVARAVVVGNYLIDNGMSPERLILSGASEYKPIFPNDTPEHRALNSRADIIVVYKAGTDVVDFYPEEN